VKDPLKGRVAAQTPVLILSILLSNPPDSKSHSPPHHITLKPESIIINLVTVDTNKGKGKIYTLPTNSRCPKNHFVRSINPLAYGCRHIWREVASWGLAFLASFCRIATHSLFLPLHFNYQPYPSASFRCHLTREKPETMLARCPLLTSGGCTRFRHCRSPAPPLLRSPAVESQRPVSCPALMRR
jgi:hypothetical protein